MRRPAHAATARHCARASRRQPAPRAARRGTPAAGPNSPRPAVRSQTRGPEHRSRGSSRPARQVRGAARPRAGAPRPAPAPVAPTRPRAAVSVQARGSRHARPPRVSRPAALWWGDSRRRLVGWQSRGGAFPNSCRPRRAVKPPLRGTTVLGDSGRAAGGSWTRQSSRCERSGPGTLGMTQLQAR